MEYPDGCSTAMRHVARKVGLYNLEVVSLWGRYFQTCGLAYDTNDLLSRLQIIILSRDCLYSISLTMSFSTIVLATVLMTVLSN